MKPLKQEYDKLMNLDVKYKVKKNQMKQLRSQIDLLNNNFSNLYKTEATEEDYLYISNKYDRYERANTRSITTKLNKGWSNIIEYYAEIITIQPLEPLPYSDIYSVGGNYHSKPLMFMTFNPV